MVWRGACRNGIVCGNGAGCCILVAFLVFAIGLLRRPLPPVAIGLLREPLPHGGVSEELKVKSCSIALGDGCFILDPRFREDDTGNRLWRRPFYTGFPALRVRRDIRGNDVRGPVGRLRLARCFAPRNDIRGLVGLSVG